MVLQVPERVAVELWKDQPKKIGRYPWTLTRVNGHITIRIGAQEHQSSNGSLLIGQLQIRTTAVTGSCALVYVPSQLLKPVEDGVYVVFTKGERQIVNGKRWVFTASSADTATFEIDGKTCTARDGVFEHLGMIIILEQLTTHELRAFLPKEWMLQPATM
jgi:hypothetical protein